MRMRRRAALAAVATGGLIVLGAAAANAAPADGLLHKTQEQVCNDKVQKDNDVATHIKIITPGGNFECAQSADLD